MMDRINKATILEKGSQCCKSLTALEEDEYQAEIIILMNQQKVL